jgi:hypothetical protein
MRSLPTPLVEQGQGEIFKALVQSVVQEERVAYKGRRVVYCSLAVVLNSHSISCRLGQRDDPLRVHLARPVSTRWTHDPRQRMERFLCGPS